MFRPNGPPHGRWLRHYVSHSVEIGRSSNVDPSATLNPATPTCCLLSIAKRRAGQIRSTIPRNWLESGILSVPPEATEYCKTTGAREVVVVVPLAAREEGALCWLSDCCAGRHIDLRPRTHAPRHYRIAAAVRPNNTVSSRSQFACQWRHWMPLTGKGPLFVPRRRLRRRSVPTFVRCGAFANRPVTALVSHQ